MKILITEYDRHHAIRAALFGVAFFHNIENSDYKSNRELYEDILAISSPFIPELTAFILAYESWFDFFNTIDVKQGGTNSDYQMNAAEQEQHILLTSNKIEALKSLQDKLKQLNSEL